MRLIVCCVVIASCVGCSSTREHRVVASATPAEKSVLLERVKGLAGTWEMTYDDGTKSNVVYQVTSNGSAVREVMFPGSNHEMTNMYTMDGSELLLTHYSRHGESTPHACEGRRNDDE